MRSNDVVRLVLMAGVTLLSLLLLLRFAPWLRFFLFFLVIAALVGIGFYLARNQWRARQTHKTYLRSLTGRINTRITECERQVERLEAEQQRIESSLHELRAKLATGDSLPEGVRDRTEKLIHGFEQELQLRRTKITFYVKCLQKLRALLRRYELLDDLDRKKSELEGYRDQHYDDIAQMEALRWNVERESISLDTIQDLAGRMRNSAELDDVLHLQTELEKMLKE